MLEVTKNGSLADGLRSSSVAPLYEGWHLINDALIAALAPLSAEQLALLSLIHI